jgi:hypothetical protein
VRQDREPTGLLDRQVETSNTSPNGTGALSVAGTEAITRSVATLKRFTLTRVRRGFRHLRAKTTRSPGVPKPTRPGPGRPPGSRNRRSAPRHEPGKTVKRTATLTEHIRLKQQQG